MVEQIAGGKALPDEVVAQIADRTDGVPLFIEKLTKSVLESGLRREEADRYVLDGACRRSRSRPPCKPRCWRGSTAWPRCGMWRRSARQLDASFPTRCCAPSAGFPTTSCKSRSLAS